MPTRKPKKTGSRARTTASSRAAAPPAAPPDRRLMERHLATMTRHLAEREFASPEDIDAYVQDLLDRYGPGKRADRALVRALEANPFVAMYLLGVEPLPKKLPDYVGFGDESEAVAYVAEAAENWLGTSGALEWFVDVVVRFRPDPADTVIESPSNR